MNKRIKLKHEQMEQKEIIKKLIEIYKTMREIPDANFNIWSWEKDFVSETPMAFACFVFDADGTTQHYYPDTNHVPPLTVSNLDRCVKQLKEWIK